LRNEGIKSKHLQVRMCGACIRRKLGGRTGVVSKKVLRAVPLIGCGEQAAEKAGKCLW
jgi:hypothetical protein